MLVVGGDAESVYWIFNECVVSAWVGGSVLFLHAAKTHAQSMQWPSTVQVCSPFGSQTLSSDTPLHLSLARRLKPRHERPDSEGAFEALCRPYTEAAVGLGERMPGLSSRGRQGFPAPEGHCLCAPGPG